MMANEPGVAVAASVAAASNALANDHAYFDGDAGSVDSFQMQARYRAERAKRLRPDGDDQFIDISWNERFRKFAEDPWVDPNFPVENAGTQFTNGRCKMLILGAGIGGLIFAVRMIKAGIHAEDIRLVDTAAGFGGTWYWNRYPGLMCDIESYTYLPFLEETGYIPKHRYAYGEEIREYINQIARKWNLEKNGVFQTQVTCLAWDESTKEWEAELKQCRTGQKSEVFRVHARFVVTAYGIFNWPKFPGASGMSEYQGDIFHASRWRYDVTGGSPRNPSLHKLLDKNVAIIGTGATGVQLVPELARWAKHLFVFQRTPSSVDRRDQRETDPQWFKDKVATSQAWQRQRLHNFANHFEIGDLPNENLVDDEWSRIRTFGALLGNKLGPTRFEDIPAYLEKLQTMDLPRQERVRQRIRNGVADKDIAEKLLPWYPSWCKRPCFHDDYLPAFNRRNVTLIDTEGKGVETVLDASIVVGGVSYPVDVIVLATGFRSPLRISPSERGNLKIIGRNGVSLDTEWAQSGPSTLHGCMAHKFPNLFFSAPVQATSHACYTFPVDAMAENAAYIVSKATSNMGSRAVAIEPTAEATEDWSLQIMTRATAFAGMSNCTPGYLNQEGDSDRATPKAQMRMARSASWGHGIVDYLKVVQEWRLKGNMEGLDLRT